MLNKVTLIGNLGRSPDMKYTAGGKAIANLAIATSESWTDKNTQQKVEKTEWHRVSVFGKLAETCGQYLQKGSKVYIEGKLQTRKWENKDGITQYTTEIVLSGFGSVLKMLDIREKTIPDASAGFQPVVAPPTPIAPVAVEDFDDEIPF